MVLGKLNSHMQEYEIRPLFYTIHKNELNWAKDLNLKLQLFISDYPNNSL